VAAFSELVRAGDDDSRKLVVEAHPELLTPEASEHIWRVLKAVRDKGGWDSAEYLDAHRDLLRRWPDEGPDAALAEYADHVGRLGEIDLDLPRASVDSMVSEMFSLTVPIGGGGPPGHVDPHIPGVWYDCPEGHDSPKLLTFAGQKPGKCPNHDVERTPGGLRLRAE
jgi:hypothetical protein